jgi:hypothetical protein
MDPRFLTKLNGYLSLHESFQIQLLSRLDNKSWFNSMPKIPLEDQPLTAKFIFAMNYPPSTTGRDRGTSYTHRTMGELKPSFSDHDIMFIELIPAIPISNVPHQEIVEAGKCAAICANYVNRMNAMCDLQESINHHPVIYIGGPVAKLSLGPLLNKPILPFSGFDCFELMGGLPTMCGPHLSSRLMSGMIYFLLKLRE